MRTISRRGALVTFGALAAWPALAEDAPRRGGTLNVGFDDDTKTLDRCGVDGGLLYDAYWQSIEQAETTLRELVALRV